VRAQDAAVVEGAFEVRQFLLDIGLESFVKTTGGKGLHVCIPIEPELGWEHVRDFTGRVATALVERAPELYVATQSKAQRKGTHAIDSPLPVRRPPEEPKPVEMPKDPEPPMDGSDSRPLPSSACPAGDLPC